MKWGSGFGLLPALDIPNWGRDGIVRADYTIVLNNRLNDLAADRITFYVERHRRAEYWEDSSLIDDPSTLHLVQTLEVIDQSPPISTDHLGQFLDYKSGARQSQELSISKIETEGEGRDAANRSGSIASYQSYIVDSGIGARDGAESKTKKCLSMISNLPLFRTFFG